jgi:hypothetical protein
MTDRETTVLARARLGLAPKLDDAERVRRAVQAAVLAPGGTRPTSTEAPFSLVDAPLRWGRVGAAIAVATVTGVGGYALGYRTGATTNISVPAAAVSTENRIAPHRTAPDSVDPPAEHPVSRARPRRDTDDPPQAAVASTSGVDQQGESTLERETRLLTRVERALRDANPLLALGLLGELEREVPGGQLAEERQAARVLAHCKLGSDSAPKLVADFIARYPSSAYRDRIRADCDTAGAGSAKE